MMRDKVIEFLKDKPSFPPEESLGIVEGEHVYSVISKASFVAISVDEGEFIEIPKYEFMNSEELCIDTEFYIKNEEFDSAQDCIECALQVDAKEVNKNWKVYYYAGIVALRQKIYDASINLLEYSIEVGCPYLRQCYDYMAISASILGRIEEAYQYYQNAIKQTPENPEVWHNIGGFYWDNNYFKRAVQSYVKALECDITYLATYEELTNLLAQLGNEVLSKQYEIAYNNQQQITGEILEATKQWEASLLE